MKQTPISPMSAKRRKQLAEQGITNPSSTLLPTELRRTSPLTSEASGVKGKPAGEDLRPARGLARPRSTGPDRYTVDAVLERDQHSCAWCGGGILGERGIDWSIHHRRPRRAGGDPTPEANSPANLVAIHGHGVSLCHGYIESHRNEALDQGFLLHAEQVPAKRQINHAVHGWVRLTDDGRVRQIED